MALLAGDLSMAEGILLQSSLIKEAIHINIQIYNWNRYVRKLSETKVNYKTRNPIRTRSRKYALARIILIIRDHFKRVLEIHVYICVHICIL